jgi:hypothetical protein
VQWDVEVGGSGLEVNDDARFWCLAQINGRSDPDWV